MSDYSKGKIYKLYNKDEPNKVYIGSCIKTLKRRYSSHKNTLNCVSKQLFQDDKTPIIELIENYSCNSKYELECRERYWMEQYPERINYKVPTRTREEYFEENKDKIKKYRKEYKQRRIICNCGKNISLGHLNEHKKSVFHINNLII